MIELENLEEGWVKFRRIPFKEGFIDKWMGDCINNPNNQYMSNMQLNSTASYYRLNGKGLWINRHDFNKSIIGITNWIEFTAEEVWNEFLIKDINDEE